MVASYVSERVIINLITHLSAYLATVKLKNLTNYEVVPKRVVVLIVSVTAIKAGHFTPD